jgi:hypothetical protein
MSLSQSDIDRFHQFASQELTQLGPDQDLEEIVKRWQTQREQAEALASIRRGVEDAEAGRFQDIGTVDKGIREKLGFPARR